MQGNAVVGAGMTGFTGFWTEEIVERVCNLWVAGQSAGEIAAQIGSVSRSAVLGKLQRMGYLGDTDRPRAKVYTRENRPVPKPVKPAPAEITRPEPIGPVGKFPPRHTCQWSDDEITNRAWRMCGHPTIHVLSPWCPYHHSVAHQPMKKYG